MFIHILQFVTCIFSCFSFTQSNYQRQDLGKRGNVLRMAFPGSAHRNDSITQNPSSSMSRHHHLVIISRKLGTRPSRDMGRLQDVKIVGEVALWQVSCVNCVFCIELCLFAVCIYAMQVAWRFNEILFSPINCGGWVWLAKMSLSCSELYKLHWVVLRMTVMGWTKKKLGAGYSGVW